MDSQSSIPYRLDRSRGGTQATLLGLVPPGSTVFDIGCSTGYLGGELRRQGCEVFWTDVNPDAIEAARSHGYVELEVSDLNNIAEMPFSGHQFDVVMAADVLEHLLSPEAMLRHLHLYVAPGGVLLVSLPNVAHVSVRLPLLAGRFEYGDAGILDRTHLHLYTFATARSLMESTGWTVRETYCGAALTGTLLNRFRPMSNALRGLLSTGIVMVASESR